MSSPGVLRALRADLLGIGGLPGQSDQRPEGVPAAQGGDGVVGVVPGEVGVVVA